MKPAETAYPLPASFRRADGSPRYAYVTLLMFNDNYLPGALTLAYGLRQQRAQADLVCLITEDISSEARSALHRLFDRVIEVEKIFVPHRERQARQYIPYVFTRLHALRLGAGGGLGCAYEKLVALDADVLPLRRYDHLFTLPAPAGVINERKAHFLDYDSSGRYIIPPSVATRGTWRWHEVYDALCPHGARIPQEITDRVREDPTNLGVNSALWVLEPSAGEFKTLHAALQTSEVQHLVGDCFDWPDMQYLTLHWSGQWTNVDIRFCGFSGYPNLSVLLGTHYAGLKPWHFHKSSAMARYGRFEDFQYWFKTYQTMCKAYPQLKQHKRLQRLLDEICAFNANPAPCPNR